MIMGDVLEYVVLGVVLALCVAYIVNKGRRKFSGFGTAGCGGSCCGSDNASPSCAPLDRTEAKPN